MSNIQDMNNRIKQNRDQRPSKRAKFKGNNRKVIYSSEKTPEKLNFISVPEKELIKLKSQIQEEANKRQRNERVLFAIIFAIAITILLLRMLWVK